MTEQIMDLIVLNQVLKNKDITIKKKIETLKAQIAVRENEIKALNIYLETAEKTLSDKE